jgi:F-type H+-transporting ATPase subunit epsilon
MTAMANHEPVLTTLRPGVLSVSAAGGVSEYVVTGGFAEVTAQGVTVIAERAMAKADVTQEDMDGIIAGAAEAVEKASEEAQEAARKVQSDVVALAAALGLNAA